ncbi:MAG: hypothetical protein JXQ29_18815 [Planctomycetes bacterium]|nr:hypothetical protein [Planctomycetota bacterium]
MVALLQRFRPSRPGEEESRLLGLVPEDNALDRPRSTNEIRLEDLIRAIGLMGMEVHVDED